MSTIKLNGTSSGSSIIKAPDSGSTNQTFTLPASSGTLVTTTDAGVAGITSTADATAITIDSAENVGFGVTPTSFYSGYTGVQVGGNGTFYGQTAAGASNNFWVGQNVRAGTDGSEKAITTGVSSQMMQSGGAIVFKTGASASADANVSWTTGFEVLADGKARAKNGLLFGTDTAAANALDDYEEGTWTPTFSGNHIGSHTLNYAIYTKIGRLVKIEAYVYNFGSIGGNGISFGITGLPFTPNQQSMGATTCTHTNVDDSTVNLSARQYLGTIYIEQTRDNAGGGWTPYNDFNGNSHVQISLSYTTAA